MHVWAIQVEVLQSCNHPVVVYIAHCMGNPQGIRHCRYRWKSIHPCEISHSTFSNWNDHI